MPGPHSLVLLMDSFAPGVGGVGRSTYFGIGPRNLRWDDRALEHRYRLRVRFGFAARGEGRVLPSSTADPGAIELQGVSKAERARRAVARGEDRDRYLEAPCAFAPSGADGQRRAWRDVLGGLGSAENPRATGLSRTGQCGILRQSRPRCRSMSSASRAHFLRSVGGHRGLDRSVWSTCRLNCRGGQTPLSGRRAIGDPVGPRQMSRLWP